MGNLLRKFIRFEDKVWFVDFTGWETDGGSADIRIVLPDGSMREALVSDGPLMDVLETGEVIPDPRTG